MRESLLAYADLMAGPDPVKAKAAKASLEKAVHAVCAPGHSKAVRNDSIKELLAILNSNRPRLVRAHAARLLGLAGSKGDDRALARLAADPELKDDIKMARERLRRSG